MTATRRDFLIAAACVASSGAAVALTPRRRISLMAQARLEAVAPMRFGRWSGRDVSDLVAPKTPDSLESRLYSQTLERTYQDAVSGAEIMALVAHGDTQSNELQLHRPETCYPAFGFQIASTAARALPLAPHASLPVRELVATAPGRQENIIYWTRLGDELPVTESEQRLDRVRIALRGDIADGLLARFSLVSEESDLAFLQLQGFIAEFLAAVAPRQRPALIGTALSAALTAHRV